MLLTTPPVRAVLDQRLPFVYNNRFAESFQVYLSRAPSLIEFCPITLRYSPSCGEYLKVLGRDCLVRATPQSMLASGFVAMCADETLGDMVRGYTPHGHPHGTCGCKESQAAAGVGWWEF